MLTRDYLVFTLDDGRHVMFYRAGFNLSMTEAKFWANDESIAGATYGCVIAHSILMERTPTGWKVKWRR